MIEPGLWDMIMRLRSRGISDTRLIAGLETVPRSRFVPEPLRARAYDETALPIACGQSLLPPLASAQMAQVLGAQAEHKVLLVGLGSGWLAGVIARSVRRVYAVDRYQQLVREADANLERAGAGGVVTRWSDGRYGWKGQAPFDRILLTCAVKTVPKGLLAQLAPDGVLVGVVGGQLSRVEGGEVRTLFPLDLPPIEPGKSAVL